MKYCIRNTIIEREKTEFVGLFFDGQQFVCDKEDLIAIDDILKEVMEHFEDPESVDSPIINREKVMNNP